MIEIASYSQSMPMQITGNTSHVGPNTFSKIIVSQQGATFFCTENNVIQKLLM